MLRIVAAALATLPLAAVAQGAPGEPVAAGPAREAAASSGTPAPVREGVYLGVGLGWSHLSEPDDSGSSYRFRLGVTRSPRLMFGLEAASVNGNSSTLVSYDAAATVFPWTRLGFVRGGFGLTRIDRTSVQYLNSGVGPTPAVFNWVENGFNLLAGIGLQLGRTNGLNVTLNLDGQLHRVWSTGGEARSVATACGWLGLEWH
jgi:hypothetical protein